MELKPANTIKTREDTSNPFHAIPHDELLKLANVKLFKGNYKVVHLDNGRIFVRLLATTDIKNEYTI